MYIWHCTRQSDSMKISTSVLPLREKMTCSVLGTKKSFASSKKEASLLWGQISFKDEVVIWLDQEHWERQRRPHSVLSGGGLHEVCSGARRRPVRRGVSGTEWRE